VKRREFVALLGGAASLPLTTRAQQKVPVVGVLQGSVNDPKVIGPWNAAFRAGLEEAGFVEGRNVLIETRSADGDYARLPALAAELVARNVDVIFAAPPLPSIRAAKSATTTIPIVFVSGVDPIATGLVSSLAHPEGNVTGFTAFGASLQPKRLEMLANLAPQLRSIGYLLDPTNPATPMTLEALQPDVREVARTKGLTLHLLFARNAAEIDTAFTTLSQMQPVGLLMGVEPLFGARKEQIVALATRHAIPAMYPSRVSVDAGGLISYGPNGLAFPRAGGVYVGRILKGEKPADLPVQQPAKFELVINEVAAKAIGLTIPQSFYAVADEVIE
jgi:putative ABC transport system substrate-binding protein